MPGRTDRTQSTTSVARRETPDGTIELFYEDLGDPNDPAVLLIMGLGAQLPMWAAGFCAQLVAAGYRVLRFDHRDSGLSAKLRGRHADGSLYARIARYTFGRPSPVPYTLVDMTDDARALPLSRSSCRPPVRPSRLHRPGG